MTTVRDVEGDPDGIWWDLEWSDLSADEQALFGVLGWKEGSWEEDDDAPESDEKDWEELSAKEQAAATKLGFTEELWDAEDEDDDEDDEDDEDEEDKPEDSK